MAGDRSATHTDQGGGLRVLSGPVGTLLYLECSGDTSGRECREEWVVMRVRGLSTGRSIQTLGSGKKLDLMHTSILLIGKARKPGVTQVPASVVISLPFSLKQEQQAVCSHAAGGGREETHRAEAESKA